MRGNLYCSVSSNRLRKIKDDKDTNDGIICCLKRFRENI